MNILQCFLIGHDFFSHGPCFHKVFTEMCVTFLWMGSNVLKCFRQQCFPIGHDLCSHAVAVFTQLSTNMCALCLWILLQSAQTSTITRKFLAHTDIHLGVYRRWSRMHWESPLPLLQKIGIRKIIFPLLKFVRTMRVFPLVNQPREFSAAQKKKSAQEKLHRGPTSRAEKRNSTKEPHIFWCVESGKRTWILDPFAESSCYPSRTFAQNKKTREYLCIWVNVCKYICLWIFLLWPVNELWIFAFLFATAWRKF